MLAFASVYSYPPVAQDVPFGGALSRSGGRGDTMHKSEKIGGMSKGGSRRSKTTSLPAVSELVGASEETGGVFDPLGLATDEVMTKVVPGLSVSGVQGFG